MYCFCFIFLGENHFFHKIINANITLRMFLSWTMFTAEEQLQPEPSSCEEIHRNAKKSCLYYKNADRCGSCGFGLEKGKITTSMFY